MPEEKNKNEREISYDEVLRDLRVANETIEQLKKENDALAKTLKRSNDILEAQEKQDLTAKLKPITSLTEENFEKMSVDELKDILDHARLVKKPISKNIRFMGEDEDPHFTMPDLYQFGGK